MSVDDDMYECVGVCVVPGRAPAITVGAYETVQYGADKQTRIKLYWQVTYINVSVRQT